MTTLNATPSGAILPAEFDSITRRLDDLGNRARLVNTVRGVARGLLILLPVTTGALFVAGAFSFPAWLNILVLAMLGGLWVFVYVRLLHRPIFQRPTYSEIARELEERACGTDVVLNNELINAILLANDLEGQREAAGTWIPHVLRELSMRTEGMPLERVIQWKRVRAVGVSALVVAAACFVVILAFPSTFAHGFNVLSRPGSFVPMRGDAKIISVEPGNDTVLAGQAINFAVTADSPSHKALSASIAMKFASGKSVSVVMTPFGSEGNQYRYQLAAAAEDLDYVVTAGGTQSERYHIAVLPQIHLMGLKVDAVPPGYTGKEKIELAIAGKDATAAKGSLEAPMGSAVDVSVMLDIPAKNVLLDVAGGPPIAMQALADGKMFSTSMVLKESIKYGIRVNDNATRTLQRFPDAGAVADGGNDGAGGFLFHYRDGGWPPYRDCDRAGERCGCEAGR